VIWGVFTGWAVIACLYRQLTSKGKGTANAADGRHLPFRLRKSQTDALKGWDTHHTKVQSAYECDFFAPAAFFAKQLSTDCFPARCKMFTFASSVSEAFFLVF
jgi:hypothetical protein